LKLDENRRDMWMAQLILVQATVWNKTMKALWQQLWCMEKIHCTANNVRKAFKKSVIHHPLLVVMAPKNNNGT